MGQANNSVAVSGSDPAIEALRYIINSRIEREPMAGGLCEWLSQREWRAYYAALSIDPDTSTLFLAALAWRHGYPWDSCQEMPPPELMSYSPSVEDKT